MDRPSNKGMKRKSTDSAFDRRYGDYTIPNVPPRFISISGSKIMKYSSVHRQFLNETAAFSSLPREVFCKVVSFLGPTSMSLCALGQVSREHRNIMASIG